MTTTPIFRFYATIAGDDKSLDEVFRPGSLSVFDAHTNEPLVSVSADELTSEGLVLFQGVDFDGLPDLALMDGQKSCYHGPS